MGKAWLQDGQVGDGDVCSAACAERSVELDFFQTACARLGVCGDRDTLALHRRNDRIISEASQTCRLADVALSGVGVIRQRTEFYHLAIECLIRLFRAFFLLPASVCPSQSRNSCAWMLKKTLLILALVFGSASSAFAGLVDHDRNITRDDPPTWPVVDVTKAPYFAKADCITMPYRSDESRYRRSMRDRRLKHRAENSCRPGNASSPDLKQSDF